MFVCLIVYYIVHDRYFSILLSLYVFVNRSWTWLNRSWSWLSQTWVLLLSLNNLFTAGEIIKHLMTGPREAVRFVSPRPSMLRNIEVK